MDEMNIITKIVISIFILVMLFWMLFYDVDPRNPFKKWWIPKIKPFFYWLGLDHEWKMFAPKPARSFFWPRILLYLKDNTVITIDPGSPEEFSLLDKIKNKKINSLYQKLAFKNSKEFTKMDYAEFLLDDLSVRDTCERIEIYRISHRVPNIDKLNSEISKISSELIFEHYPISKINNP